MSEQEGKEMNYNCTSSLSSSWLIRRNLQNIALITLDVDVSAWKLKVNFV